MSELFDRADEILRKRGLNKDWLLEQLRVAKSNVKTLQDMMEKIGDSSGVIASKIALEESRIEGIESDLKLLGVTPELDVTKNEVVGVLSNDGE